METIYLGIIVFLFLLAIFDLLVGVSNDAVNFLSSAVGAKVAAFKTILIIAAIGVFVGAISSNGMMDIARHGIFQPEHFYFEEIICIFLAVMVTDVVLLDIFNSLGMPTSTTVSMVFELLGGTFILALIKIMTDSTDSLTFGTLLNTEKALSVILGIFLSVAIAFIVGAFVQWMSRIVFTFNYKKNLRYTVGIFGGIATTALSYFVLIKGLKNASFIAEGTKTWISDNTGLLILLCFVGFTILMQLLHFLKVNVFKIIVLLGTFGLALAFASNDLVNFIGVPLAGLSSYEDFVANANGMGANEFLMSSLQESAKTPLIYLLIAAFIMVWSLMTSKKARGVVQTSVNLSRQEEGDEMFGSSSMARMIVRKTTAAAEAISRIVPSGIGKWIDSRFKKEDMILEDGAAFDLVRASVTLVVSGLLIIMGTSLKLPLSTTYVTFIVAMGSSLADRAWGRESAVYRITGVLSVIGGWFITAFVAFTICAIITLSMYYGGIIVMTICIAIVIVMLIRSNIAYKKKAGKEQKDELFAKIIASKKSEDTWRLLKSHIAKSQTEMLSKTKAEYCEIVNGLISNDLKSLRKAVRHIRDHRDALRKTRQRELVGMRRIDKEVAIEYNTWFHLSINSAMQMMYCLRRIIDPAKEHVDNNFNPLPQSYIVELLPVRNRIEEFLEQASYFISNNSYDSLGSILSDIEIYQKKISDLRKIQIDRMQEQSTPMKISFVYLSLLQETKELLSNLRHLLRALDKIEK